MNDAAMHVLRVTDLSGVLANALLGGVLARSRGFDLIGFAVLAVVSGLGGGIIRDILLQKGTPVALVDHTYVLTALVGAAVAFLVPIRGRAWERSFPVLDALALGCWAAVGAQKALSLGLEWPAAIALGAITAAGGGVVRDVLLRQVPAIFGGNTLFVTPALLAAATMVLFHLAGQVTAGLLVATGVGAGLTLLSHHQGWRLPAPPAWSAPVRFGRSRPDGRARDEG
ncbi:trimeric intracellular cation channel family protein [Nakamurella sp.]|uniref:trimeric intracellular cation channel family protein n=1 Tax=Nakamurella sp. TaxID=1869182 RepID=UPI003782E7AF